LDGYARGMENKLVKQAGFPLVTVNASGVPRQGRARLAGAAVQDADVVLAVGGRRSGASVPTWCCRWAATSRFPAG
jgi:hypothetical protein